MSFLLILGVFPSFLLFVHPLLGLDHYSVGPPLGMAELFLCDVTACRSILFVLIDDGITF